MAYIGNSPQTQGFTPAIDYFSGNGSTVTFTLSRPLVSTAQVIAVIENVPQNPSTAFSVSGNSITFTSAPPSGSNNIWVEYTSLITQYNAISQDPSVIGDITATGGFLAVGDFGNTYTDGTIVDYVTGNARITTGPADGFTIYNGGTAARNALMAIDSSGNVGIGTASPTGKFQVNAGGTYQNLIYKSESANTSIMRFAIDGDGPYIYQSAATSEFRIASQFPSSFLTFYTGTGGERMRIDSSGNLLVGTTTTNGDGISFRPRGSAGSTSQLNFNRASTTTTGYPIVFQNGGSDVGYIQMTNTTVSYVNLSDYRLKDNIVPMTGALNKVSALKPVTYKWKADGSDGQGFIAHELQEVVPECVTGEKDAVDEEGNPKYQGIDTSFLIATLTAAIQEQQAIIEDLKARIETLEAK